MVFNYIREVIINSNGNLDMTPSNTRANTRAKNFKLSIVTPFFNEQDGGMIDVFFKTVIEELQKITENWEIIAVDDGSQDDSFTILKSHHQKEKRIKVIKLSRNFGKEAALTAGLNHSTGDAVIPMDADLQDPAYLFEEMISHWQQGYDAVIPIRNNRKENILKRTTASLFYWFFSIISDKRFIIKHASDFRLLDKKIVDSIRELKEYHRFMKGLLNWPGFHKKLIHYNRTKREYGITKFSYKKLFILAIDGIFSFSIAPIRFITFFGFLISILSFSYGAFLAYQQLFAQATAPGYTSLMVGILFMGGLQMIALGVIGEYIGRIYNEVKNRPIYIIDEFLK